jgi:MFS family permease
VPGRCSSARGPTGSAAVPWWSARPRWPESGWCCPSFAQDALQLGLLRGLTGLGIGAIITTNIAMTGEFASRRWRGTAISLTSVGYPAGAIVAASCRSS